MKVMQSAMEEHFEQQVADRLARLKPLADEEKAAWKANAERIKKMLDQADSCSSIAELDALEDAISLVLNRRRMLGYHGPPIGAIRAL